MDPTVVVVIIIIIVISGDGSVGAAAATVITGIDLPHGHHGHRDLIICGGWRRLLMRARSSGAIWRSAPKARGI